MSNGPGPQTEAVAIPTGVRIVRAVGLLHELLVTTPLRRLRAQGFEDVTPALLAAIVSLDPGGSALSDVRRRGGRTKQATSQTIAELRRRGYASLVAGVDDRRSKFVVPTEIGAALRHRGLEELGAVSDEVARILGVEARALASALERLAVALEGPLRDGGAEDEP